LAAYVLRPMKKAELEVASEMVAEAADAVQMILQQGFAAAMNKYNRKNTSGTLDQDDSA